MCVIIAKKAGVKALDNNYFERAWTSNPDGGGVVWKTKDGQVMIQKGFMERKDFIDKLKEINTDDTAFIAHFRIKSVGEVKPENCHPFVLDHLTFAHNGTLTITPLEGKTDSETFGLAIMKDKDMNWVKDNQLLLEMALGHSKFAIMDNETGEIFILNKDYGSEKDDAWFSNESAFEKKPVVYNKGYSSYYASDYNNSPYIYRPISDFGKKKFTLLNCHYSKTAGCWVDKFEKEHTPACAPNNFVLSKRGLYKLSPSIEVPANYPQKKYKRGDKVLAVLLAGQNMLQDMIRDYHKRTSFDSYIDREEEEANIHALNALLDAVRRLVRAEKAVCLETLYDFILDVPKAIVPKNDYGFMTYLVDWADSFLEDCGLLINKKAANDNTEQVETSVAN